MLFLLGFLTFNLSVISASEFNFAVTTTTPDSQIDKEKTYFDIKLAPKQEEELKVNLRNDTNKDVKVNLLINSATTNSNVVVEYGKNNIKKDESLTYDLKDYLEGPESVTLKAKSTETVIFTAKMPEEAFDGTIAGGITFKEESKDEEGNDKGQGMSIKNEYSYVVAVLMRQTLEPVDPNLNLLSVAPGQINARNMILSKLQNDQKTYINQVAIDAQVMKKNSDDILYSTARDSLQIAPNSNFEFPISLEGQSLEPGEYRLVMTVYGNKAEDGEFVRKASDENEEMTFNNQWTFEESFKIDAKVAKELNKQDVTIEEKDNTWIYLLIGIFIILILLCIIIWLLWKRRKEEEEAEVNKKNLEE